MKNAIAITVVFHKNNASNYQGVVRFHNVALFNETEGSLVLSSVYHNSAVMLQSDNIKEYFVATEPTKYQTFEEYLKRY